MMNRIYEICLHCENEEPIERKQPIGDWESVNYCPKCGGEMTILHIYEICPCCMDELIERKQEFDFEKGWAFEEQDSINYCPKCGHKLEPALWGDKIDNTIYRIILQDVSFTDYMDRKKFLELLMKMGNITMDEALKKYEAKDSVIFEGNARDIFINTHLLPCCTSHFHYTIIPNYPFICLINPFYSVCPSCGSDTVPKEGGVFCKKCNEWILYPPL